MYRFTPRLLSLILALGIGMVSVGVWNQYTHGYRIATVISCPKPTPSHSGSPRSVSQDSPRFKVAGVEDDKEVTDLYLKFQNAVASNDKRAVASIVSFPFRYYLPTDETRIRYRFANNRASFLRVYDQLFDARLKGFIGDIDAENPASIWAKPEGIAVGRGTIWIGVFPYTNRPDEVRYRIQIRTIHGNGMTYLEQH